MSLLEPAGSLMASGEDMVRWMEFMLGDGRSRDGTEILSREVITLIKEV